MRIVSVCGGNGSWLFSLKRYIVANIENRSVFYTPEDIQWKLNFNCPYYKSLESCDISDVDLIIGAPDCGNSSILSYSRAKKLGNPQENESVKLYINSIHKFKPKIFVMENLPKLLDFITQEEFQRIFSDYNLQFISDSVSVFGNSQVSRKRLILIGYNKALSIKKFKVFPVNKLKTSSELLNRTRVFPNKYMDKENFFDLSEPLGNIVCMSYNGKKLNLKEIKDLWLGEYNEFYKWPVNDNPNLKTLPGVYRNRPNGYPMTVRKQNRQFNHDGTMMSPREMAIIQGIPMRYKLWLDNERFTYCINKARTTVSKCPPYEIGLWVKINLKRLGLLK